MKSHNPTLLETARTLAYDHAIRSGWTFADWELVCSKRRRRSVVAKRHELMRFLARRGFPLTVIGAVFRRDHSSVFNVVSWMPLPEAAPGPRYHTTEVGAL